MQNDPMGELENVTRKRARPDEYRFDAANQLLLDEKLDAIADRLIAVAQELFELGLLLRQATRP